MAQQQSVYVAERRIYLDSEGKVCDANAPNRRELLVAEGGRLPIDRAIELGLVEQREIEPGLTEHDRVSVDHPLYAKVFTTTGNEEKAPPPASVSEVDAVPTHGPTASSAANARMSDAVASVDMTLSTAAALPADPPDAAEQDAPLFTDQHRDNSHEEEKRRGKTRRSHKP